MSNNQRPGRFYVEEREFKDFKHNFHTLIDVFNHNVTGIKDDVCKIKEEIINTKIELAKNTQKTESVRTIVWWIMGILATIIGSAAVAVISGQ